MRDNLLGIVTMTVAAGDEAQARRVVDQVAAPPRHTLQSLEADRRRPGRWTAVLHMTDPQWTDDGSDSSLATIVRAVLRTLGVTDADTVAVDAARPTAGAVLTDPPAAGLPGAVEWLLAEVWDNSAAAPEPQLEELEGEGVLDAEELAALAAMLETHLWVQADLRLADPEASEQVVADLTKRLGGKAVLTGRQRLDGGLLRLVFHLGVNSSDPAQAVKAAIDRLSRPPGGSPAEWVVDHAGTNAVWTSPQARAGIARLEIRATFAPGA